MAKEQLVEVGAWIATALAVIGGVITYVRNGKRGNMSWGMWILKGLLEAVSSAFIGIVTYVVAVYVFDVHPIGAAGVSGYVGHVGTRQLLLLVQRYVDRKRG